MKDVLIIIREVRKRRLPVVSEGMNWCGFHISFVSMIMFSQ